MSKSAWHSKFCQIFWRKLLGKTPFFVQCYILSKVPLVKISIQVSSISRSEERVSDLPKRYIYNYHESCHDKIVVSVTLLATKFHITGFIRVSATLLSDQLKVSFWPVGARPNQNKITSRIAWKNGNPL